MTQANDGRPAGNEAAWESFSSDSSSIVASWEPSVRLRHKLARRLAQLRAAAEFLPLDAHVTAPLEHQGCAHCDLCWSHGRARQLRTRVDERGISLDVVFRLCDHCFGAEGSPHEGQAVAL